MIQDVRLEHAGTVGLRQDEKDVVIASGLVNNGRKVFPGKD